MYEGYDAKNTIHKKTIQENLSLNRGSFREKRRIVLFERHQTAKESNQSNVSTHAVFDITIPELSFLLS